MNWRPHTDCPDHPPLSALLAASDDEGGYYLCGLYTWDGAYFRHEETDSVPWPVTFWWVPESEVLQGLPA